MSRTISESRATVEAHECAEAIHHALVRTSGRTAHRWIIFRGHAATEHRDAVKLLGADARAKDPHEAVGVSDRLLNKASSSNIMKDMMGSHTGPGFLSGGTPWSALDAERTAQLVAAASDLALLVDDDGIIRNIAISSHDATLGIAESWLGKPFVDTVTSETKSKAEALLRDSALHGLSARRQINHVSAEGADFPVAYTTFRLGDKSGTIAVGRDLRAMSALQHRLVETQQEMERSYCRLRHTETRYRLLFHHSTEPVMVVDSTTRRVVDANASAGRFFNTTPDRLLGKTFPFDVVSDSARELGELLVTARMSGRESEAAIRMTDGREAQVSVSSFRQESSTLHFVRLMLAGTSQSSDDHRRAVSAMQLLDSSPDGFAVTDLRGTVLSANRSFLDLCQLSSQAQALGRPLSDWIGRPGADMAVMLLTLKQHGAIRLLQTSVRGEHGTSIEVELSAAGAADAERPCIGFVVRDVSRRMTVAPQGARDLTRAVEQLTELVGRVSLPDLLRDTVDLVERHFIEAALVLTGDNRTAAAELLGLSRQSLYIKLRRHKLVPVDKPEVEVSD